MLLLRDKYDAASTQEYNIPRAASNPYYNYRYGARSAATSPVQAVLPPPCCCLLTGRRRSLCPWYIIIPDLD